MNINKTFVKSYWIRSGTVSVLQQISNFIIGFGSFFFLVRLTSKDDYGTWVLFLSTISLLEIARNELIQNALIKYVSIAENNTRQKIIFTSFIINMGMTGILALVLVGISPFLSRIWDAPVLINMFLLYLISFFITGIQTQYNSIEQAYLDFRSLFLSSFLKQFFFLTVLVIAYVLKYELTLIQLTEFHVVSTIVGAIVSWCYARKHLTFNCKFDFGWAKKLLNYGKYTMATSLHATFSNVMDQMMVGGMLSSGAVSSFNIANRISNMAHIPTNAMATIVFPQGAIRFESEGKNAMKLLYEKSVGSILAIVTPAVVVLYLFAEPIIHIFAGERYLDAAPLLRVTLLYCLLIPYSRQTGTILESTGNTKLNFLIVLFTSSFNIILNIFLISKYGVIGAVYGALLARIVFFVTARYYLKKLFQINLWAPWKYAILFYPEIYRKLFYKTQ
ncbi:flippase [Parapedobacter soli]|uniref:flippase n=1 Tax=Parapedobacter soli TaxID=416955 RepID=UPI0021C7A7E5|nr:flippase [Parapedobacter soli]